MKTFVFSCFLLFAAGQCTAQTTDTAKLNYNIDTLVKQGAVFVMDGMVLQKPYHFNPDSIISISVIKHDKAQEWFEGEARNGLVVMISRRQAIADYKKKLSGFSKKYKRYLQTHQNDDKDVLYVVNGVPVNAKNQYGVTRELYNISYSNLKKVGYSDNFNEGMKQGATVFITTKQQN